MAPTPKPYVLLLALLLQHPPWLLLQLNHRCCSCCDATAEGSVYQVACPAAAALPLQTGASFRTPLARAAAAACSWTLVASLDNRQWQASRESRDDVEPCACSVNIDNQTAVVVHALLVQCAAGPWMWPQQHGSTAENKQCVTMLLFPPPCPGTSCKQAVNQSTHPAAALHPAPQASILQVVS
jgi:hypothetical protein